MQDYCAEVLCVSDTATLELVFEEGIPDGFPRGKVVGTSPEGDPINSVWVSDLLEWTITEIAKRKEEIAEATWPKFKPNELH